MSGLEASGVRGILVFVAVGVMRDGEMGMVLLCLGEGLVLWVYGCDDA